MIRDFIKKLNKKIIYGMIGLVGITVSISFIVNNINGVLVKEKNNMLQGKTIVIDAGHGGRDGGSEREGVKEKDINLSIALKVEQLLQSEGAKVMMTRVDDKEVSLKEITQISNKNKADLLVSIHQNAIDDNVTYGIETWFEKTKSESGRLAELVQESIIESTNGKDRGLKFEESLYVTKNTEAPSVLVECGFISSNTERELLLNNNYQKSIASGIVKGIKQYFNK
ncbi:N-acetylmuramoyl-L-alanine amidase family protein [Clostridium butyricum]|uniref:N-acetylmuramoyl-L-alanine amidase family protein n=1 Tax=Clostridium butyricum TaxID=1492 RepID=UPI0021028170|nr:N-acetylmuramoyl-L-alanine amidase [Clostridium butyricum]MCQ2014885.1 N-acetylmuramoyl-L-alanine amidase [Clostridium butyricum]MCQ2027749.1 N-acetylmuramoyl-L-alanine amidase [Clostridium butyricum]